MMNTHTENAPWFRNVNVGQKLRPIPLWNESDGGPNRLDVPTVILDIKNTTSQTGVTFKVKSIRGIEQWLDAAWFEPTKENLINPSKLSIHSKNALSDIQQGNKLVLPMPHNEDVIYLDSRADESIFNQYTSLNEKATSNTE